MFGRCFVMQYLVNVLSSFAFILVRTSELVALLYITVFQISFDCSCSIALPRDVLGLSAM